MRLIDADELLYDLEIVPLTGDGGVDANDLDDIIKKQPTIEPQIIRCKDCKHYNVTHSPMGFTYKWCQKWGEIEISFVLEDEFCSRAERRTE